MSNGQSRAYGPSRGISKVPPYPITAPRAPNTTDIGYTPGQDWIDSSTLSVYILAGYSSGQAGWVKTGSSAGGDVSQVTGNFGSLATPEVSGNLNVIGTGNITVSCAGNTATISDSDPGDSITAYIVGLGSTYTTIQAALDAANADGVGVIYVKPGIYTENLTLYSLCDIVSSDQSAVTNLVTIIGNHTPPASGTFKIRGCLLQAGGDIISSVAAGSTDIFIESCGINHVADGAIFNLPNWTGSLTITGSSDLSSAASSICQTASGAANLTIEGSSLGNGATPALVQNANIIGSEISCTFSVVSGGGISIVNSFFDRSLDISGSQYLFLNIVVTTSTIIGGASTGSIFGSNLQGSLTYNNNATGTISNCSIQGSAVFNATSNVTIFNSLLPAITQNSAVQLNLLNSMVYAPIAPAIGGAGLGFVYLACVTFGADKTITAPISVYAGTMYLGEINNTGVISTTGSHIIKGANNVLAFTGQAAGPAAGTATLVGGTVTVATTTVTATSRIFLTVGTLGTVVTPKSVYVPARVVGASFIITSEDATDTSQVHWLIVESF